MAIGLSRMCYFSLFSKFSLFFASVFRSYSTRPLWKFLYSDTLGCESRYFYSSKQRMRKRMALEGNSSKSSKVSSRMPTLLLQSQNCSTALMSLSKISRISWKFRTRSSMSGFCSSSLSLDYILLFCLVVMSAPSFASRAGSARRCRRSA